MCIFLYTVQKVCLDGNVAAQIKNLLSYPTKEKKEKNKWDEMHFPLALLKAKEVTHLHKVFS